MALPTIAADGLVRLSDYRGTVVYLDFWDSWCAPCRESMPWLTKLRERYAREDFEVVAVNLDADPEDGRRFLRAHPVTYPVAMDPAAGSKERYALEVLPTAFLIDRTGRVRYVHVGFRSEDREKINTLVAELVGS